MSDKFNYAIGFRWNEDEPDGEIGTYSFFSDDVFFGTMEEAQETLEAVKVDGEDGFGHVYRIYKLTEVV